MQWQIINRLNELLITRAFCIQRIKMSPPIETARTFRLSVLSMAHVISSRVELHDK
jgi:hypothetical protein